MAQQQRSNNRGGGGGNQQNKGCSIPKPVNDLLAMTPGKLFELCDEFDWDLEKLTKLLTGFNQQFQNALNADKQTLAGIPIVFKQKVLPAMAASSDFPQVTDSDGSFSGGGDELLAMLREAQVEKKKQWEEKQKEDAEKKAEAKKAKEKKPDPSAAVRRVHTIAESLPRDAGYPFLSTRWNILLFGRINAGTIEEVGFFDALDLFYGPKEVESFYAILGKGKDEEVKAALVELLKLRDAQLMAKALPGRQLIKLSEEG